ncbi:MAG: putative subtilase-type serine protease precursor [Akkermansiaceae bacterium]|nr:putative subtilase-type serine protease precursor [Akkermansiaceae bacterium]
MKACLLITAALLIGQPAWAGFSPVLNLIEPRGAPRGTEVSLELYGERLDGAQELFQYIPGIEVRAITVENDKHATAKVFIQPDAPLGEHNMRLRTTGGVSFLRSFYVGQFPTVNEVEPNDRLDQAQRIELNTTVQGIAKAEDPDYYVCSLKKGQRLSVEVEAMRLGRTMFDASVAIVDAKGFEIASCDDSPLLRNDAFVSILAPDDGDYRVLVRESAYEGNDNCEYRLSIGTFPRPKAIFPDGAKPGETVEFRFIGDPAGDFTQTVTIPADAAGRYPIFPQRDGLYAPSPHWIKVSPLAATQEVEPNNNRDQATRMPDLPSAAYGVISAPDDEDFYSFHARKDDNLTLRVIARELRSPLDSVLSIRDAKGKGLANNDDQGGPDSVLQWTATEEGEYLAVVRDQLKNGGPDFCYRLEILHRDPVITANLPVVERNNSQKWKVFDVPRGNRYAAVVNVTRENIGGNLTLTAEALPPGVTMDAPVIDKTVTNVPVVFEATTDAPAGGLLCPFKVHSTGDGPAVTGALIDTVNHVEINNQGPYHSADLDRVPVSVVDEAPFRIELEAPSIPLVRNGTANLKVHATRKDGYKEAITLHFLWSPPGLGAPAGVTMPGDQSDAAYEVNANGDAGVGEWPVCVLAEANTPQGPVMVSTGLVKLKVVEPYLAMALDMAATEQGKPTVVLAKIDQHTEFQGDATAELMGLPHGAVAKPIVFNKTATEIQIPIEVAADATVGKHSSLFCKVTVPENGQGIIHSVGGMGTIRIDKPAEDAPPAAAQVAKVEAAPTAPVEKPLSRLEQLRQKGK